MPTTLQTDASLEERLAAAFERNEGHTLNGASATVQRHRQEAIARFKALGLPTRKLEFWKYTDVARALRRGDYAQHLDAEAPVVTRSDVEPHLLPDLDAHVAVTVNGRFDADLSDLDALPEGVVVTSLAEAGARHSDLFERHYARYARYEEHALTALNTAFARDGVFVYVPKGTTLEKPLFLLHLTQADENLLVQPRHLFIAEEGALAKIIERPVALGDAEAFTNAVTEVFVGEKAHLDHYRIQDEGERASQVQDTHAYQEDESVFDTLTVTLSGKFVRNNVIVTPDASHCETHLYGLYMGRDAMHVDNHTIVEHAAPDCFSNELYKGILTGRSTGVFNGRVHVHPGAQRINAYQSNKNIVLTDTAQIYSKPELEIYADDVQCSHASTTGQLDEEAIFYLRSRGLSETRARTLLLHAFASDVVNEVKIDALRAWLDEQVAGRFE